MTMTVELYTMRIAWHDLLRAFDDPAYKVSRLTNDALPESGKCIHLTVLTRTGVDIARRQLAGIRCTLFGSYRYEREQFQTHIQLAEAIIGCVRLADAKRFREWYRLSMMLGDAGSNFMSRYFAEPRVLRFAGGVGRCPGSRRGLQQVSAMRVSTIVA